MLVYWYDLICFGIVGVSCFVALYVLRRREGSGKSIKDNNSGSSYEYEYKSLLLVSPHADDTPSPIGHVTSTQLWTSCWRGLHPIWLLGLRLASLAILCTFLAWDIQSYDASIFVYYTEYSSSLYSKPPPRIRLLNCFP